MHSYSSFKFGSILPPAVYFSSLLLSQQTQNPDESFLSMITPGKEDEDEDFEHKDMKLLDESFMSYGKVQPIGGSYFMGL